MADKVVHFEIPVNDMTRAKDFYSIFGWNMQDWPMPDGSAYVGIRSVEVDEATHMPKEPGAINGGMVMRDSMASMPILAMQVDSIDATIAQVEAKGGKVVKPKWDVMGMGFYAYISDTEGNTVGLWEDAKKA